MQFYLSHLLCQVRTKSDVQIGLEIIHPCLCLIFVVIILKQNVKISSINIRSRDLRSGRRTCLWQIGSIDPHQDNWINSTLVTHYELICDRTSLVKNAKSFQMAGNDYEDLFVSIIMYFGSFWSYMKGFFVGATSAGFVGDRFGRKVGLILFHLLTAVCLVLNGWLSIWNYYAYCILQMLTVRWGFERTRV